MRQPAAHIRQSDDPVPSAPRPVQTGSDPDCCCWQCQTFTFAGPVQSALSPKWYAPSDGDGITIERVIINTGEGGSG